MKFLACLVVGRVVVVLIAKLIIFIILIQHVRFLHDGVAHGDVHVRYRLSEQMDVSLPEVNGFLKGLYKLELVPSQQLCLHSLREPFTAFIDKLLRFDIFNHVVSSDARELD